MIASSPIRTLSGPGWLLVVLAAASVSSDETIYVKEGGEVTLQPKNGSVTDKTKSIIWKVGEHLAVDLDLDSPYIKYYRIFEGQSNLNNRTGELTIRNLTYDFTNMYTVETGTARDHKINLVVLAAVPVPTITPSCPEGANTCTLTCEGNTARAEPVEYIWMTDDTVVSGSTDKTFTVKNDSSGVRQFRCKMKNPVSEERSESFANPLKAAESGPRISTGVTVLVILLFLVILVAIGHRMKTGEWFYNKPSMPWEGDFWRNTKAQQPQAAASESNGNTTPLKGQLDEETAVTDL